MRSSKSRSRNKSNRNNRNNPGNIINRVYDSSGPEGKVRGTPQQIIDKYTQLARDAFLSNDRVAAENFQQHAEHYTRLLSEAQREMDARRQQSDQQNRERQQREREERESRENRAERKQTEDPGAGDQPAVSAGTQPDVIESQDSSGLVETPESKPKKAPARARKPRKPAKSEAPEVDANAKPDTPEAPEAAE